MELGQRLGIMMRILQQEKIIESIYHAKNKGQVVAGVAKCLEKHIESLHDEVSTGSRWMGKSISAEEAVQICTICLISGLDDIDLVMNYEILPEAMEQPCDSPEYSEVAKRMNYFLLTGHLFTVERTIEELVEIFFGNS